MLGSLKNCRRNRGTESLAHFHGATEKGNRLQWHHCSLRERARKLRRPPLKRGLQRPRFGRDRKQLNKSILSNNRRRSSHFGTGFPGV